jgi:hypothetical protein
VRGVIVDDGGHIWDIQTTGCHVSGHLQVAHKNMAFVVHSSVASAKPANLAWSNTLPYKM